MKIIFLAEDEGAILILDFFLTFILEFLDLLFIGKGSHENETTKPDLGRN